MEYRNLLQQIAVCYFTCFLLSLIINHIKDAPKCLSKVWGSIVLMFIEYRKSSQKVCCHSAFSNAYNTETT